MKVHLSLRGVAVVITIFVMILLFLTGTNAIKFDFDILKKEIIKGDKLKIKASVEIEELELANISYLELKIFGPDKIVCRFSSNATIISGCEGVEIVLLGTSHYGYGYGILDLSNYGYGYGYGPGILVYEITIDSELLKVGEYRAELFLIVGNRILNAVEDKIIIKPNKRLENRCSIRAFDGSFNVDSKDFSNNRIKFYISSRKEELFGRGSLSGQKGRDRFSYRFDVEKILRNDDSNLVLYAKGVYRLGRNGEKNVLENVTINFDRVNNRISVEGDRLKINSMMINFIEGCDAI